MLVENGQIKVLREALNIVATARAFFPNGLTDLDPVSANKAQPDPCLSRLDLDPRFPCTARRSRRFDGTIWLWAFP